MSETYQKDGKLWRKIRQETYKDVHFLNEGCRNSTVVTNNRQKYNDNYPHCLNRAIKQRCECDDQCVKSYLNPNGFDKSCRYWRFNEDRLENFYIYCPLEQELDEVYNFVSKNDYDVESYLLRKIKYHAAYYNYFCNNGSDSSWYKSGIEFDKYRCAKSMATAYCKGDNNCYQKFDNEEPLNSMCMDHKYDKVFKTFNKPILISEHLDDPTYNSPPLTPYFIPRPDLPHTTYKYDPRTKPRTTRNPVYDVNRNHRPVTEIPRTTSRPYHIPALTTESTKIKTTTRSPDVVQNRNNQPPLLPSKPKDTNDKESNPKNHNDKPKDTSDKADNPGNNNDKEGFPILPRQDDVFTTQNTNPSIPSSTTNPSIPSSTTNPNIPSSTTNPNIPSSTTNPNIPTSTTNPNIPTSTTNTNIPTSITNLKPIFKIPVNTTAESPRVTTNTITSPPIYPNRNNLPPSTTDIPKSTTHSIYNHLPNINKNTTLSKNPRVDGNRIPTTENTVTSLYPSVTSFYNITDFNYPTRTLPNVVKNETIINRDMDISNKNSTFESKTIKTLPEIISTSSAPDTTLNLGNDRIYTINNEVGLSITMVLLFLILLGSNYGLYRSRYKSRKFIFFILISISAIFCLFGIEIKLLLN